MYIPDFIFYDRAAVRQFMSLCLTGQPVRFEFRHRSRFDDLEPCFRQICVQADSASENTDSGLMAHRLHPAA
jgi:hypothetical protein